MRHARFRSIATVLVTAIGLLVPTVFLTSAPADAGAATTGIVVFIDDGDTIDVDIAGDGSKRPVRVRFLGIQAMELTEYDPVPSRLRGDCWGVPAARALYRTLFKKKVRLTATHDTRNRGRIQRYVDVRLGGRWVDAGGLQLDAGLVIPDLIGTEYTRNRDYMMRAERAAAARAGMWGNPSRCGGPAPAEQLSVQVNWDADGNDQQNINGEWIDITNNGTAPADISGWWVRDAAYRGVQAHGYTFPAGSVVPAGEALRLRVGHGAADATTQYWNLDEAVFANVTGAPRWMGDGAWLFDPQGDMRFWDMYPCRVPC